VASWGRALGQNDAAHLMGGLDVPTSGTISVDGDEITHMSASKLTQWRRASRGIHLSNVQPDSCADGISNVSCRCC